jgi:ABC-2 type transport system permease protein
MIRVISRVKMYSLFTGSVIQTALTYRINFYLFVLGGLMKSFVAYYLWKAIFSSSTKTSLNGFTLNQMVIYIFMSIITAKLLGSEVDMLIASEVQQGSIATNLIRPISYPSRLFFMSFGNAIYTFIIISIPLWIGLVVVRYITVKEPIPNIQTIMVYMFSLLLAFTIQFLFNFCFGMLAFYVTYMWGLSFLKRAIVSFISGQIIPFAFFPLWLQHLMNFVPFGSTIYVPVMIYMRKYKGIQSLTAIGIQALWIIVLLAVSQLVWNHATRRLTVLGG